MPRLTIDQLKNISPGQVFGQGTVVNGPGGVQMTDTRVGDKLAWVAVKGGNEDWAIYLAWEEQGHEFARTNGQKTILEKHIRYMMPCDDDVFRRYRI